MDPVVLRSVHRLRTRGYRYPRERFKGLGVLVAGEPYVTFEPEYEAAQLGAFADMVEKGFVYKGFKTVYWCIDCQTALAAAEIEYEDESSPSIYVAYPIPRVEERFEVLSGKDVSVIIWTTTPWTLPASMAVALQVDYEYVFVSAGNKVYLLAAELLPSVEKETGSFSELSCIRARTGGLVAIHALLHKEVPLVLLITSPSIPAPDLHTLLDMGGDLNEPLRLKSSNPVDPTGRSCPRPPCRRTYPREGSDRVFRPH